MILTKAFFARAAEAKWNAVDLQLINTQTLKVATTGKNIQKLSQECFFSTANEQTDEGVEKLFFFFETHFERKKSDRHKFFSDSIDEIFFSVDPRNETKVQVKILKIFVPMSRLIRAATELDYYSDNYTGS